MVGGANKKIAKLTIFMLTQDLLPAHWNWTPSELQSLNDSASMAKVILKRLQDAGLEVIEAHIIVHDKDEVELWDEYENGCKIKLTSKHIHFVCKFAAGKGDTLENIAKFIGVAPNFIVRPKRGRYAYDNMLAYLIHIKYPKKYQYDPKDVITVVGKTYIEYYRECRRLWMHGRAERILAEIEYDIKDVERMIMDGEIGKRELLIDDKFKYVYQKYMKRINDLVQSHDIYEGIRERELKRNENSANADFDTL